MQGKKLPHEEAPMLGPWPAFGMILDAKLRCGAC